MHRLQVFLPGKRVNHYKIYKENQLIENEEYIEPLEQKRLECGRYFWSGVLKVTLKDGQVVIFRLRRIFKNQGENEKWTPSQEELNEAWFISCL